MKKTDDIQIDEVLASSSSGPQRRVLLDGFALASAAPPLRGRRPRSRLQRNTRRISMSVKVRLVASSFAAFLVGNCCLAGMAQASIDKPPRAEVIGHFARAEVTESSAIVASRRQPGVYWTLNDSGGAPEIYGFDVLGQDLGAWRLGGTTNIDWEALSRGPCGPRVADCLYIADTGDNQERRPSATLYRLAEPRIGRPAPRAMSILAKARRLDFVYPDGPHDVEAITVSADGAVWLITKGRTKGVQLFRLDAELWMRKGVQIAAAMGSLPIVADRAANEWVTDAGLSPDGLTLAVRTYASLYLLRADPKTGMPVLSVKPERCALTPLREAQGEGLAWYPTGEAQILTSEGAAGQISLIACVK